METKLTKARYLTGMTVFTLLWCGVSGGLLYLFSPAHYQAVYAVMPFYFFLFSLWIFRKLSEEGRTEHNKLFLFLGIKMAKLLLSVALLVTYCLMMRKNVLELSVVFVVNYLIYLGMDIKTWYVCRRQGDASLIKEVENEVVS